MMRHLKYSRGSLIIPWGMFDEKVSINMLRHLIWSAGWAAVFAVLIVIMPTGRAQAYLDPGSGSLIVQIIIGGILAALVAVRMYWSRIVGFVTGRKPVPSSDDQDALPGDDVK